MGFQVTHLKYCDIQITGHSAALVTTGSRL